MKIKLFVTALVTALVVVAATMLIQHVLSAPWKPRPVGAPTPVPAGEGWMDLLSEDHLPLWKNITDDMDIFEMDSGEMHIFGRSLTSLRYVGYTGRPFADFELHLEYKVAKGTNSGLFLRVKENDPVRRGFEAQILDDHGSPPSFTSSGSIYDVVSPMFNMARPAGEWNSYDVVARGTHIVIYLNGWKVIDTDFANMTEAIGKFTLPFAELPREGLIALQDHGGSVRFRNIVVRSIDQASVEGETEGQ